MVFRFPLLAISLSVLRLSFLSAFCLATCFLSLSTFSFLESSSVVETLGVLRVIARSLFSIYEGGLRFLVKSVGLRLLLTVQSVGLVFLGFGCDNPFPFGKGCFLFFPSPSFCRLCQLMNCILQPLCYVLDLSFIFVMASVYVRILNKKLATFLLQ